MTPKEEQFNRSGCIPRCLIELAKDLHGTAVNIPNFIDKYHWLDGTCGLMDPATSEQVARDLNLGRHFYNVSDLDEARKLKGKAIAILVMTHGQTHHCRLVKEWKDDGRVILWNPIQDGSDRLDCETRESLAAIGAEFMILSNDDLSA